jgi:hypothetical protein
MTLCNEGNCPLNRQGVSHESHETIESRPVNNPCNDPRCAMNRMGMKHETHDDSKDTVYEKQHENIAEKISDDYRRHKCIKCKDSYDRIDLWRNPKNPKEYTCRNCRTKIREDKQKSFESDFRHFRKRQDYVPQEDTFQTSQSRISDKEFDELIQEFEQAHWSEISSHESMKHQRYIESLFRREFQQRRFNKYKKSEQKTQQSNFEESDLAIHYNLLEISEKASDKEIKDAYRRLVLKWHPDKNPQESKYAEKMLISIKIAFETIMKNRK